MKSTQITLDPEVGSVEMNATKLTDGVEYDIDVIFLKKVVNFYVSVNVF